MIKKLKEMDNVRKRFVANFVKYGTRFNFRGYPERTIIVNNVQDESGLILEGEHTFNDNKGFMSLGELNAGEYISFEARFKVISKKEYKLSHPFKIYRI